jgi:hypothetical protein
VERGRKVLVEDRPGHPARSNIGTGTTTGRGSGS